VANQSVISSFLGEVPQFWRKGEISWSIQALYICIYIYIYEHGETDTERERERERERYSEVCLFFQTKKEIMNE